MGEQSVTVYMWTSGLGRGGAEKQLLIIARELSKAGVRCEIVVFGMPQASAAYLTLVEECVMEGVRIHYFDTVMKILSLPVELFRENAQYRGVTMIWSWGYRAELQRLLLCPFKRGLFSIRSASATQAQRWRWLFRLGRFFTWRYISNSHLGVQIADRVAPGIAAKAKVIPNALEDRFLYAASKLDGRPAVLEMLMLGNVRYTVKGYDLALVVGQKIRDAALPIRIRIGGAQYAGETDLQNEIIKAGLSDIVTWDGPVVDSLGFLQSGHAFLLLSRYEGMPNALFEAMAVGLPCVATAVGDLPYYAAESNGFKVVPIEDVEAAFHELCWIWNNWDEAVEMARRATHYCQENFSEKRMIQDVFTALELDRAPEAIV